MVADRKILPGLVLLSAALLGAPSLANAQGRGGFGGPGGGFGGPGGMFGGGNDAMLLQNDDVRQELGLVDDQVEKLTGIREKMQEEFRSMFTGLRDLSEDERRAKFEELQTKMRDRQTEMQREIDDVLLPHQSKRLKQIGRQMRSRQGGGGVNSDSVADELKLTDEQKEKLKEKAVEVEKKLREKMAKLRKEAEDELLSVLTPEQRAEWKDMVGDPFEMQFRRPGGPGGQGGFGGRGGPGGRPGN